MNTASQKIAKAVPAILLTAALLAGCSSGGGHSPGDHRPTIGVVQLMEHPSLDTIRDSFLAEMEALGYGPDRVDYQLQNAQGEQTNLSAICQKFVGDRVDLIVAIATPTAQAAASATQEIPILFSAVTDPVAAKLLENPAAPGGNVTGTSDAIPVDQVLQLCRQLTPQVQSIGLLYTSSEINAQVTAERARTQAQSMGYQTTTLTISEGSELWQAAQTLASQVDAIYTPIDNTIASSMQVLARVGVERGIPVYVGADSMVADGGLATVGIRYQDLGNKTAQMARQLLEGTPVCQLPVATLDSFATVINPQVAGQLGIAIPPQLLSSAQLVGDPSTTEKEAAR